jgi:hypothetical protein
MEPMAEGTQTKGGGPASWLARAGQGNGNSLPNASTDSAESPPGEARGRDATARFGRSRQMADCLRCDLLYSEKRPRDVLFGVIEQIVAERRSNPMILSRLTREAAARARQQAQTTGFAFGHWETVSKAVVKTMLCAGVLLTTGCSPIVPGITAQATVVAGLKDRYADITEAFLLEVLIRRLGDVTTRDHTALAHALFRQFDPGVPLEELEDRVVILVAQLVDQVDLRGELYCVRESAQEPGSS